jgi:hypothetical protein
MHLTKSPNTGELNLHLTEQEAYALKAEIGQLPVKPGSPCFKLYHKLLVQTWKKNTANSSSES